MRDGWHSSMSFFNHSPNLTLTFTLAQDNQVITAPGGAGGTSGTTAAPAAGNGTAAPASPAGGGAPRSPGFFDSPMFLMLIVLVIGLIIMSSMGQRRERKKREAMVNAVKKHDRVQTIGGVIGSVVEVKPDYIVLKVDESSNTRITFSRTAIAQVLTAAPETAGTGKETTV
jgi:preprotein translocase subunit YajC